MPLDAMTERHIAAPLATATAVRKWDGRRAAGDVTATTFIQSAE